MCHEYGIENDTFLLSLYHGIVNRYCSSFASNSVMQRKLLEDPVVLFASPPDLNDLCSVTIRVESQSGKIGGNVTTQPKILKCREVIFTEPDVIAAPSYEQFDCFTVIMSQSLFRTGRLQTRMKNNGLQPGKPMRVNPVVYQACLRYTLLARLAPAWNKTGDWLIQGRDFLSHTGCANAVKCEAMVQSDQLYLSVVATMLRLSPLQLVDLNLSQLEVQSLLYNAEHGNGELALHNAWCRVVPSMKKGRLCSISLSIPEDSPFTTYRDIKRHWKNTYGFRLPETDDDIFYAQISFCGLGGKQFTYPNICLRAEPLQSVPRVDGKPILSAFLQDVHSKLPSACGHALRFQPQLRYPLNAVYSASQDIRGPGANLSKRSSTYSSQPTLRDPRHLMHLKNSTQPDPKPTLIHTLKASTCRPAENTKALPPTPQTLGRSPQPVMSSTSLVSQPWPQSQDESEAGTTWSRVVKPPPVSSQRTPRLWTENHPSNDQNNPEHSASGTSSTVFSSAREGFVDSTTTPVPTPLPSKGSAAHRSSLSLHKPQRQPVTPVSGERLTSHTPLPVSEVKPSPSSYSNESQTPGSNFQAAPQSNTQLASTSQTNLPQSTQSSKERQRGVGGVAPLEPRLPSFADSHGFTVNSSQSTVPPKIVPVFRPKALTSTKNRPATNAGTGLPNPTGTSARMIPTFKPKLKSSTVKPNKPSGNETRLHPGNNKLLLSSPQVTSTTDHTTTTTTLPSQPQLKLPVFQPRKPHPVTKIQGVSSPGCWAQSSAAVTPKSKTVASKLKKKMLQSASAAGIYTATSSSGSGANMISPRPGGSMPVLGSVFSEALALIPNVTLTPGGLSSQGKRKGENVCGEGGEKKARSKPQVQDLDIEALSRADQLQKANTVTLMSWLKDRGVHCKTKDKKGDLVDRVKVFLAITTSEP